MNVEATFLVTTFSKTLSGIMSTETSQPDSGNSDRLFQVWYSTQTWKTKKPKKWMEAIMKLQAKDNKAIVLEIIQNEYCGSRRNFNDHLLQQLMDGEELKMGKCVIKIREIKNESDNESASNEKGYDFEKENKTQSMNEVKQNRRKFKKVIPGQDQHKLKMEQKKQQIMNNYHNKFAFQLNYYQNQNQHQMAVKSQREKPSFLNAANYRNCNNSNSNRNNSYYQNSRNIGSRRVSTEKQDDGFDFDQFDFNENQDWNRNRNGNYRNSQNQNRNRKRKRNFDNDTENETILDYIKLNDDIPRFRIGNNQIYENNSCQSLKDLLRQRNYGNDRIPQRFKDPFGFWGMPRKRRRIISIPPIPENAEF